MATPKKRGGKWHIQFKIGDSRPSGTFDTKVQALAFETVTRAEIMAGKRGEVPNKTFGALLSRYAEEVSPKHKGERWERLRIGLIQRDKIASVRLTDFGVKDVSEWRDRRLQAVSAASVRREWTLMSHACSTAVKEWKWLRENPFRAVERPSPPNARQRVYSEEEIACILHSLGNDPRTVSGRVCLAFEFALETAMRAGEIIELTWENVHERHVHLPTTKNGSARNVPLSAKASGILEQLRGPDEYRVFALESSQLDAVFRKARDQANVSGATFHDTRRTALTRLASRFSVLELARISGHRDIRMLSNVYYAPDINDLADKMG